ncbi:MAG: hypothetical protein ABF296_12955 [Oceanococcaceae bacterium]
MASADLRVLFLLLYGAACAAGGFWGGYQWRASLTPAESTAPAAERRIDGGAVVLERSPPGTAEERALPTVPVPEQAVPERRVRVVIQPIPVEATCPDPPSCVVDLSLVREGDGRRVVAISPTGAVIGGLDVPLIPLGQPTAGRWAAGVAYHTRDGSAGAWLERDIGRVVVGLDLHPQHMAGQGTTLAAVVRVGWRF